MIRIVQIVVLVASVAACRAEFNRPTEQVDLLRQLGPGVHAQMVQGGVRVVNASTTEIRLVVVNPYWLGLIASCNGTSTGCTYLRPGAEEIVPLSRIYGIEDGPTELVVRYWRPGDENPTEISVMRAAPAR